MKTLKESLLDDIETTIANGASVFDAEFNTDTIPTPKDFESYKSIGGKIHRAQWYCPNVIKRYRSKYPDFILNNSEIDSIIIVLNIQTNPNERPVADIELYFGSKTAKYGISPLQSISGWKTKDTGGTVQKYKRNVIDTITKIAKDPHKMDALMEYAYKSKCSNYKLPKRSFNEL